MSATLRQNSTRIIIAGLIIITFLGISIPQIGTAPLKSDATLAVYASQQIANGHSPYSNYIIMHPPAAHLIGAVVISLGRAFNLSDAISIKILCLVVSLTIIGLVYIFGEKFEKYLGILAAVVASFNLLILMTVWGMHTKLIMLLFYTTLLIILASKHWFAAGIFWGLTFFSWGGGFFLSGVVFSLWLLSKGDRKKSGLQIISGFLLVVIIVSLILLVLGGFENFFFQFVVTVQQYVRNKISGSGVVDSGFGIQNIIQSSNLTGPDIFVLAGGILAFLVYVVKRKFSLLNDFAGLTVVVSTIFALVMIFLDYQSPFDLLPLIPSVSILFAWLIIKLIDVWVSVWKTEHSPTYAVIFIIMLSITRFTSFPEIPDRLQAQTNAAEWLITASSVHHYSIQSIGDLSIQVLGKIENATPIIHAGPKTFLAMQNDGWTLDSLQRELSGDTIGIVTIDVRNSNKDYLEPFLTQLQDEFWLIGYTEEPTMYVYAAKSMPESTLDAMGFIQLHNDKEPIQSISAELIPVSQLSSVKNISIHELDDTHLLFSYDLDNKLNLYWWTQPHSQVEGILAFRWLTTEGESASVWTLENIEWLPGFTSMSTYNLPVGGDDNKSLELCILADYISDKEIVCQGLSVIIEFDQ